MNSVERVKAICKERKLAISKLEKDLKFSNGYIGQLRKGTFPADRLVAIADYLGVSTDYLLGKEETTIMDLFTGNSSRTLTPMEAQIAAQAQKRQPARTGELSEDKRAMYDFIDALSDEQIKRLLQIARAAFEK